MNKTLIQLGCPKNGNFKKALTSKFSILFDWHFCKIKIFEINTCYWFFQKPELTLRIEQSHFDLNFKGQEGAFQLEGGFYKKIVSEKDLIVGFDDENDGKLKNSSSILSILI